MWYYKDYVWLHGYKMFKVYLKIPVETHAYSVRVQTLKNLENVKSIRSLLYPIDSSKALQSLIVYILEAKHIENKL